MSYSEFVRSRFKSGEKIAEELTPHKALWIAIQSFRVCWNSEQLDKVKKYAIYNKTDSEVAGWSQLGISHYERLKVTHQQAEVVLSYIQYILHQKQDNTLRHSIHYLHVSYHF